MSKKNKKQEIKDVYIDADHIPFLFGGSASKAKTSTLKGKTVQKEDADLIFKRMKIAFKSVVKEYTKVAETESIPHDWTIGKTYIVTGDDGNFRYDIYPKYKANRDERPMSDHLKRLRDWARKKYAPREHIEADDKVAYYVSQGHIGVSPDKDLYKGVAGIWYNPHHYHKCWFYPSEEDAHRFNHLQYVMGDLDDNIRGIEGVGIKTAEKLLDKHGWDWNGVVSSYHEKGYTTKDAVLTRRLVSMKQWTPKKGIKLFKGKK